MLATTITLLAIVCACSVATMCAIRWRQVHGFKAAVHLGFAAFAAFVAFLNLTVLFASDDSFLRTAILAYVAFATAGMLPAARALGNLTYDESEEAEKKDAPV